MYERPFGGAQGRRATLRGLYAIADGGWSPPAMLPELARKFLEGGCRIIQVRIKDGDIGQILDIAKEISLLKMKYDFQFIVNDHADIAVEIGADGVHVGEHDEPVASIKKRHGSRLIVGYSSHSLDEAIRANKAGADYIAFGAIFPTKTKGPGHPVQGPGKLREVVKSVSVPVVAIGGIGRENIQSVIETGVSAVAMISALAEAKDIVAATKWFVDAWVKPSPSSFR